MFQIKHWFDQITDWQYLIDDTALIIYRFIGSFGIIWTSLILVVWIKQEKYCDIERAAGAPAQISRPNVSLKRLPKIFVKDILS